MSRFDQVKVFDKLLSELGVPHGQFEHESSRFNLSPREWLEEKLRAAGWVRQLRPHEAPKCERECCK